MKNILFEKRMELNSTKSKNTQIKPIMKRNQQLKNFKTMTSRRAKATNLLLILQLNY